VVTVLSDDNKKYLSTDLLREEPLKPDCLSSRVRLTRFRAFKRVCQTCCDPEACLADYPEAVPCADPSLAPCPRRPNR
jgi:cysteine synthase A